MDIDAIRSFIDVSQTNSLSKSSLRLNMTTPALSKRIKLIEAHFDTVLFNRSSKGIFLNEDGKRVLESFQVIQHELDELQQALKTASWSRIRIGVLPSFSLYYMTQFLNLDQLQQLDIAIENNSFTLKEKLNQGAYDAIVGDLSLFEKGQYVHETLYKEPFTLVLSKTHPLNKTAIKDLSSLKNYNLLLLEPPCDTFNYLSHHFKMDATNIHYYRSFESMLTKLITSHAISIVPHSYTNTTYRNLSYLKLNHHKRHIGIVSSNFETLRRLKQITHE
ncbi:LysR family transcriptional regulator [Staphylococcus massiliensis]|uniref:LysR family transcriptional regulator n=1 Tax=Staphylococcus massiliensis S46 TaxID=1229783 RepID=K9AWV1_9STAP|nr:LysR family transcriptional regulator [Staphylococcus massiliensis]EKU45980.1 LysR family transcriptional regulator [Staphylococcus massiliensis S46]MCG3399265.1 LysR family transcriptional regulator [Staphylococcus massiliensis]POA01715.1 LysR family transcriptional regulator [Staphylococcus massiliensis CCUG 55927]